MRDRRATFRAVAPRLELAHRQERERLAAASVERIAAANAVVKAQRLVAHRELQLLRAATRNARYYRRRAAKVEEARGELRAAYARARRAGLSSILFVGS